MTVTVSPGGNTTSVITYDKIESYTTVGNTTSTITIGAGNTIPQTYKNLVLRITSGETVDSSGIGIRINGDSTNNYSYMQIYVNGGGTGSGTNRLVNQSWLEVLGTGYGTNVMGVTEVDFPAYTEAGRKTAVSAGYNQGILSRRSHLWYSGSVGPITMLTLITEGTYFKEGSTFTLYGRKG